MEGVHGLMIAADVKGDGHLTGYPSDKPTVALQIPFAAGSMPAHRTLHEGTCRAESTGWDASSAPKLHGGQEPLQ